MSEGMHILPNHSARGNKKKKRKYIFMAILFIVLLIAILYPLFSDFSLTGFSVFSGEESGDGFEGNSTNASNSGLSIYTRLGIPDLEIREISDEVVIKGNSQGSLNVGSQKLLLDNNFDSEIIFKDFNGKIYFKGNEIYLFEGKASRVLLNSIPIESKSDRTLKVSFDEPFFYKVLKVSDTLLSKLDYITSGTVSLDDGKTIVNLHDEEFLVRGFSGDLKIDNEEFILNGKVSHLEIKGKQNIVVGD